MLHHCVLHYSIKVQGRNSSFVREVQKESFVHLPISFIYEGTLVRRPTGDGQQERKKKEIGTKVVKKENESPLSHNFCQLIEISHDKQDRTTQKYTVLIEDGFN